MKSFFLLIIAVFGVSQSSILHPKDFDVTIEATIAKVNTWFGLSTDYVFNTDKNYPPIEEDVTFWIYSPNSNSGLNDFTQVFITDSANDISSKIVQDRPIGFLIHGWIDSFNGILNRPNYTGWMKTTAMEWAKNNNQSVICVDWHRLANYPYSISALENTKLVGKFVGEFIEHLRTTIGISLDNVVLVGHSLGGQITGYVGAYHNGQIGTIIALDPAAPLFTLPMDMGIENRLDTTDAKFVQVIYTSCGTCGSQINCGHGNFYANGGAVQPGCIVGLNSDAPDVISCSHFRAVLIFRSSCNPINKYEGVQCTIPAVCNILKTELLSTSKMDNILIPVIKPKIGCTHPKTDLFGIFNHRVSGSFNVVTKAIF